MFSYTNLLALISLLPPINALPTSRPPPLEKRCQKSVFPTIIQAINESSPNTNYPNTFNTNGQTTIYQNLKDNTPSDRLNQIIGFQNIPSTATNCILNAFFPPSYPITAINGHSPPLDIFTLGVNGQLAQSLSGQQTSTTENNYPFNWNTPSLFNNPAPSLLGTTTLEPGSQSVINKTPFDCVSGLGGNVQNQGGQGVGARGCARKRQTGGGLSNSTGSGSTSGTVGGNVMAFLVQVSKEIQQEAGVNYNWQGMANGLAGSQSGNTENGNGQVQGNAQSQGPEGAGIDNQRQAPPSQSPGEENGGVGRAPAGYGPSSRKRQIPNIPSGLNIPSNSGLPGIEQFGAGQLGAGQLGAGQLGSGELGAGQLGAGGLGVSQFGTGGLGTGQSGSGQLGASASGINPGASSGVNFPEAGQLGSTGLGGGNNADFGDLLQALSGFQNPSSANGPGESATDNSGRKRQIPNIGGFDIPGNGATSGAGEFGTGQLGTGALGAGQFGAGELGAGQLGAGELGAGQFGAGASGFDLGALSNANLPEAGQSSATGLGAGSNGDYGSLLQALNGADSSNGLGGLAVGNIKQRRQIPNAPSGFNAPGNGAAPGAGQFGTGAGGAPPGAFSGANLPGSGATGFGGGSNVNYGALIQALNASGIPPDSNGRGGLRPGSLPANIEEMIQGGAAPSFSGGNFGGTPTGATPYGGAPRVGSPAGGFAGAGTASGGSGRLPAPTMVAGYKREDGAEPNIHGGQDTGVLSVSGPSTDSSGPDAGDLGGAAVGSARSGIGGGNGQNLPGFFLTYDC